MFSFRSLPKFVCQKFPPHQTQVPHRAGQIFFNTTSPNWPRVGLITSRLQTTRILPPPPIRSRSVSQDRVRAMTPPPTPPRSRTPPTSPPLRTPLATPSGRTALRSQGISASTDSTALGTHRHRYTEATLEVEDDLGFSSPYVPRYND